MATSPNYAWAEPDNSSLVKNGAQDIRALGDAIDTSVWNIGYGQAGKNKIINGDFGIWQRGTSFSTAGGYTADRFYAIWDGTGTKTISQQTFSPGTAPVAGYESQYYLRFNQTVAGTGGSYNVLTQRIEDVRTFAGQTVTVSFWAKSASTTAFAATLVQNFGSGGSGNVTTSFIPSTATTTGWVRYTGTASLPSIAGKTVGTSSFLELTIVLPTNATFTLDFWGIQAEYGSKATPFETATGTLQGELAACQRYYWRTAASTAYVFVGNGQATSTSAGAFLVNNPVSMRVAALTVDYSTLGVTDALSIQSAITSLTVTQASNLVNNLGTGGSSGLTQYRPYFLSNQASASGYIGFGAEL
jgi:hypothetical protein